MKQKILVKKPDPRIIYNQFTKRPPYPGQTLDPLSLTEPDLSYSLQEIINKFASGRNVSVKKLDASFVGTDIQITDDLLAGVPIEKLDHVELMEFKNGIRKRVNEISENLSKTEKQRKEEILAAKKTEFDKLKEEIIEELKKSGEAK